MLRKVGRPSASLDIAHSASFASPGSSPGSAPRLADRKAPREACAAGGAGAHLALPRRVFKVANEVRRGYLALRHRSVAQLVEHRSPKPRAGGSSPSTPANSRNRRGSSSDKIDLAWPLTTADHAAGQIQIKTTSRTSILSRGCSSERAQDVLQLWRSTGGLVVEAGPIIRRRDAELANEDTAHRVGRT
jgi:hypothetical protein